MLLVIIYLAFISLGLPDSLLGSAWPVMHQQLGAAVSVGGMLSMTISAMTITSSLANDRLVRRLGTGRLTCASVALTAAALLGFSASTSLWQLWLWAIPFGLGAGAVDASLNAYVATHYEARHMNWLHCMWGLGASAGPVVMAWSLSGGTGWQGGYRTIGIIQCALVVVLVATLRLWATGRGSDGTDTGASVSRSEAMRRPGVPQALVGFFCYCALEQSCGLWGPTFMVMARGVPAQEAASLGSLFFVGITAGRLVSGVLTLKLDGRQLQRLGEALIAAGVLALVVVPGTAGASLGLILVGLGCAPIYPQMIQLTPVRFGADAAGPLMGLQMACAYVGSLSFPPVMGLVMEHVSPALFPVLAGALLVVMTACLESCDRAALAGRGATA